MKPSEPPKNVRVGEQAATWFARSRASDFSPQDFAEFKAWLYEDDGHCRAYMEIEMLWHMLGSFAERSEIKELIQGARALRGGD